MLVAQAKYASERFTDSVIDDGKIDEIEAFLRADLTNIALIGMPGCGKSTLSGLIGEMLGREVCELDELIAERAGADIPTIFKERGETAFRDLEQQITAEQGKLNRRVLSTGGGVIKRAENVDALRQNSVVVWIKRPIEQLPSDGRPLSSASDDAVVKLWNERKDLYAAAADITVENVGDPRAVAEKIVEGFYEIIGNKRA